MQREGLLREFLEVLHGEPVNSHVCLETKDRRALVFRVSGLTHRSSLLLCRIASARVICFCSACLSTKQNGSRGLRFCSAVLRPLSRARALCKSSDAYPRPRMPSVASIAALRNCFISA